MFVNFGLVAAEARSNGGCIIATRVGGIPEIVQSNGILIDNINHKILSEKIDYLIQNEILRKKYQSNWRQIEEQAVN